MPNILGTLSTAISGLYVNNKALETTSHNITNVNNPYYVRQQIMQSSAKYRNEFNVQIGTGVTIDEIRQVRDNFLDEKYRKYSSELGLHNSKYQITKQVEGILNEINSEGLQSVMNGFWSCWNDLSTDPSNLTKKGLLKESAESLVDTINNYANQLDDMQINLNNSLKSKVEEVNKLAKGIAKINGIIQGCEGSSVKANDYRDQRNELLDKLSELINIDYYEQSDGTVNVRAAGRHIVIEDDTVEILTKPKGIYDEVYWSDDNQKVMISTGELAGILEARGDIDKTIIGKKNGTVKQDVEIVIAVDTTNPDIDKVNDIINTYEEDMKKRGLKPTFKLVSFGGGAATELDPDFLSDITSSFTVEAEAVENFGEVVDLVDGMAFKDDSLRELIVITDESVGGDTNVVTNDDVNKYINKLRDKEVITTVLSNEKFKEEGDVGESGWGFIADKTGGRFMDINDGEASEIGIHLAEASTSDISVKMGEVESFTEMIPAVKQKLNTFINILVTNLNYIHRKGSTVDGKAGEDFFVAKNGELPLQAGNIKLNDNLSELNNIITADKGFEAGNGSIAEEIFKLKDGYLFGNQTVYDYYNNIISDIGIEGQTVKNEMNSKSMMRDEIGNRVNEISAVSLDEEMADMLKFEKAYQANSRIINAVDDMLDRIINKLGVVGR